MNVTFVTNIPAPYREKLHELLSEKLQGKYSVIYCANREPNRQWEFELGSYKMRFLSAVNTYKGVHSNFSIFRNLKELNPDIVITNGFYPTMIYAFIWALLNGRKHIVFTDGTLRSESSLSLFHRLIRKIVFYFTVVFIGTSLGSEELYRSYNIHPSKIFRTYLCIDNDRFQVLNQDEKQYDLMFSGQFIDRKMPMFFAEVAKLVKAKLGKCKVLILGSGELQQRFLNKLTADGVDYKYAGYIKQDELPQYYSLSKLFLFPTLRDPWGIVTNEALASGVPVITCNNAGVSHDLVIDHFNGLILPLNETLWAESIISLISSDSTIKNMSLNALNSVKNYNFEGAVDSIYKALLTCT